MSPLSMWWSRFTIMWAAGLPLASTASLVHALERLRKLRCAAVPCCALARQGCLCCATNGCTSPWWGPLFVDGWSRPGPTPSTHGYIEAIVVVSRSSGPATWLCLRPNAGG